MVLATEHKQGGHHLHRHGGRTGAETTQWPQSWEQFPNSKCQAGGSTNTNEWPVLSNNRKGQERLKRVNLNPGRLEGGDIAEKIHKANHMGGKASDSEQMKNSGQKRER